MGDRPTSEAKLLVFRGTGSVMTAGESSGIAGSQPTHRRRMSSPPFWALFVDHLSPML